MPGAIVDSSRFAYRHCRPTAMITHCRIICLLVKNELEIIWKDTVMTLIKALARHFTEGTEQDHKGLQCRWPVSGPRCEATQSQNHIPNNYNLNDSLLSRSQISCTDHIQGAQFKSSYQKDIGYLKNCRESSKESSKLKSFPVY
jgi:hypothetical protein